MSGPFDPGGQQPPFGPPYGTPADPGSAPTVPGGSPSAPGWGYGQPAAPSSPYGQPLSPYGAPGPQSQFPTTPGQQWGQQPTMPGGFAPPPAPPRKSRRGLWITLAVILVLLLAGGGAGVYVLGQLAAPAAEALVFCNHLKGANYAAAYNDLSSTMQAQVTGDEFAKGAQFITVAEGNITRCQQSAGSGAYSYSYGAKKATLNATMTRSISGTLAGNIGLVQEGGAWKVGSIDTSLLGINLGALKAAGAFCAALQTQNYTGVYALLSSTEQQQAPAEAFATVLGLNDTIDGKVTACSLTGFTISGSDSDATLNVSFTRATLGVLTGAMKLKVESGAWKVDNLADSLGGTDVTPILIGTQFCADLVANKLTDAYALFSSRLQSHLSQDTFVTDFTETAPIAWAGCTPDLKTYKVSGSDAQFNGTLNEVNTDTKATLNTAYAFYFVKEGSNWKFDGFGKPNS
ncbi:MAG TPA: proline-rich domain-containing protein [Ktedonobacterales bacterium]|nr:proline-rich domain-containing protein [Ktedonobacterales bacterium]